LRVGWQGIQPAAEFLLQHGRVAVVESSPSPDVEVQGRVLGAGLDDVFAASSRVAQIQVGRYPFAADTRLFELHVAGCRDAPEQRQCR
jgi:hypothetical protein